MFVALASCQENWVNSTLLTACPTCSNFRPVSDYTRAFKHAKRWCEQERWLPDFINLQENKQKFDLI
jgi:hypothetical protein